MKESGRHEYVLQVANTSPHSITPPQFGALFGGERFVDYIGEISLLKDFGKASEIIMSEEEKAELEQKLQEEQKATQAGGAAAGTAGAADPATGATEPGATTTPSGAAAAGDAPSSSLTDSPAGGAGTPADPTGTHLQSHDPKANRKSSAAQQAASTKLTPEQREKLEALEKEKEVAEEKRIKDLTEKLKERIRPFVNAKNPGDKDDSETQLFEKKMRQEAEDLKLESFGVELLHVIGSIYLTKSTVWIKSQRHHFLGLPGFFSKLKEKTGMVKETWNLLGSAVSVQMSMEDLQKRQEKGDVPEDEMAKLEAEMSGKMLLATWRGTRWEVTGVLRKVCDGLLNEKGVDQKMLLNRARALALLGSIYKQVQPDESDEERRELERLVAEAAGKNKKKSKKHSAHQAAAATSTPPSGASEAKPAAA